MTKISEPVPWDTTSGGSSPKEAVSLKWPVMIDEPSPNTSTDKPTSAFLSVDGPPARFAQRKSPVLLNLVMKISSGPSLIREWLPKVATPENVPVVIDEPSGSAAIECALSFKGPPAYFFHKKFPCESSLPMAMSSSPRPSVGGLLPMSGVLM